MSCRVASRRRIPSGCVLATTTRSTQDRSTGCTNPHAPSMYRANGAVRNVPEFYEAFEVAEGDELYLAPEERVKIW